MNDFDVRWRTLARRGRPPSEPETAVPWGFAARVVARAAAAGDGIRLEDLWLRRARQSVAFMAALALVLGTLELRNPRPSPLAAPTVENAVSLVLWRP